jgi:hypothetical protein
MEGTGKYISAHKKRNWLGKREYQYMSLKKEWNLIVVSVDSVLTSLTSLVGTRSTSRE